MIPEHLDINQCVKEVSNFFSVDYVNICTGVTTHVPRGNFDIAAPFIFAAIMASVAVSAFRLLSGRDS